MKRVALLILIFYPIQFFAQTEVLIQNELKLQQLFSLQVKEKLPVNDSVVSLMNNTLNLEGAFEYPFDSLKYVGKIFSEDKKVRILTWNIVLPNGTTQYFGYILQKNGNNMTIHFLKDSDSAVADNSVAIYNKDNWYGSLVYDIIDKKIGGEMVYTLLSYDPADLFIKRKITDVLWFRDGLPLFGMPVFKYQNRIQNRIIFEYSAKAQMSLTYNKESDMIIFDHLAPTSQSMTGNFMYYVPDLSFDGLKFEKSMWEHVVNIDPRN